LTGVGKFFTGKTVEDAETQQYCKASAEQTEDVNRLPRKFQCKREGISGVELWDLLGGASSPPPSYKELS
jgi:hypothetical protein